MPSSIEIGNRLRALRGDKTIIEVCAGCAITRTALANYESGYRTPRDEVKKRIAKYFGKTVDEIFFD